MGKAKPNSQHWEWEAKASAEKITGVEKERDKAKEEAQVARLATIVAGDAKAKMEGDLAMVQDPLAVVEEAKRKVEAETTRLEV